MEKHAEQYIPVQQTGRSTEFSEERGFDNRNAAHQCFETAAAKMLTVNKWHEYAGPGSSKFCLTNNQGDELVGFAHEGFYFSIDLPTPGSDAGDGLEWVMIERIDDAGDAKTDEEFLAMTIRPVPNPKKDDPTIAHFYKDVSTNTFIVKRIGNKVSACVYGRNETPNNGDVDLHDKVRNTLIALTARIGLSGPQWKKLVKGLLDDGAV